MSEFTIGEPTTEVPPPLRKYGAIWEAVKNLTDGAWLPISFPNRADAQTFTASGAIKTRGLESRRSGTTVYLRRKQ